MQERVAETRHVPAQHVEREPRLTLTFGFGATALRAVGRIEGDARRIERYHVAPVWERHDAEARGERFERTPAALVRARDVPSWPVRARDIVAYDVREINVRTVVDVSHLLAHHRFGREL